MRKPILLIFLVFLGCFNLWSDEIIVVISNWPPWKIITENPETDTIEFSGIDVDILDAISERTDLRFSYITAPWKRAIELFKKGEVDLISNFSKNSEREKFSIYIYPTYHKQRVAFYTDFESNLLIREYADLANRRIGVISGSAYFDQFDYDESLRKEQVLREDQLIRMLVEGRIDVAIGWEIPFEYSLERFNRKNRIVKSPFYPLDELPTEKVEALSSHFAFSKKTKMLRYKKMFEETLQTLLDDGTVDEIIMRNLSSVE